MAGTSIGLINDTLPTPLPPGGTIFDMLNTHDISWKNYYSTLPTLGIYISLLAKPAMSSNLANIDKFYSDTASGSLPSFCIVDPDFDKQSEEDPQDVQFWGCILGPGGQRGDVRSEVVEDHVGLELRRAWRVLRPRGSSRGCHP